MSGCPSFRWRCVLLVQWNPQTNESCVEQCWNGYSTTERNIRERPEKTGKKTQKKKQNRKQNDTINTVTFFISLFTGLHSVDGISNNFVTAGFRIFCRFFFVKSLLCFVSISVFFRLQSVLSHSVYGIVDVSLLMISVGDQQSQKKSKKQTKLNA